MTTDLAVQDAEPRDLATADREEAAGALAHILATGDLAKLSNEQRVAYYLDLCSSLSLNPRSRPFDWLLLDGKLVLYPNKSCAEQLRREHQISVKVTRREVVGEMFVVEVEGRTPNGRTDESTKYVPLTYWDNKAGQTRRLTGNNLANAFAKAETGAKRRLVLSMVGLASPPDPDEVKGARVVVVDGTGRMLEHPTQEQRYLADHPNAALAIGAPTYETVGDASESPLAGSAGQHVRPVDVEPPARPEGPRPTFRASDEDVKRWLGAWFAAVKGTGLDHDEARHRFVAAWTADEWPKNKRTDSLRTAFARMTAQEAGDFLAHVRALCDDERRALLEDADAAREEQPRGRHPDQRVHDAVMLTGGPAEPDVEPFDEDAGVAF